MKKNNRNCLIMSVLLALSLSETGTKAQNLDHNGSSMAVTEAVLSPPPGKIFTLVNSEKFSSDNESLTPDEVRAQLKKNADSLSLLSKQQQESISDRACSLEFPSTIFHENGRVYRLLSITDSEEPLYLTPFDIAASVTASAYRVIDPGTETNFLSGSGELIGLWDPSGGVRITHSQFSSITQLDTPSVLGDHATWVAGMLASQGEEAIASIYNTTYDVGAYSLGVSPGANIVAYDTDGLMGELYSSGGDGLNLSVHSYGVSCGWKWDGTNWIWFGNNAAEDWKFGAYLDEQGAGTLQLDQYSHANPYGLLVFAASNDRNIGPSSAVTYYLSSDTNKINPQTLTKDWNNGDEGGFDSLSPLECAKNVLTVGGIYDIEGGYTTTNDVVSAPFSGMGPTDDGRIKPDVVSAAIRTGEVTTNWWNGLGISGFITPSATSDTSYSVGLIGNSFAAPVVAGGLGLVLETRKNNRPEWINNGYPIQGATLRALAIHTADEAGNPGPDYTYGYGLVNIERAVNLMYDDITSGTNAAYCGPKPYIKEVLLNGSQKNISFKVSASSTSVPLKVTICWNDPQGSAQTENEIDETTGRLINDLDMRIITPAGATLCPYILDPDLTNKSSITRGDPATTGDDSRNNVEQIVISNPITTGDYTVNVTHKGSSLNGNQQWVSIIISGNETKPVDFRITKISNLGDGDYIVKYKTVVGGVYRLQGSTTASGPWTDATGNTVATLETTTTFVQSPNGETTYFWRAGRVY